MLRLAFGPGEYYSHVAVVNDKFYIGFMVTFEVCCISIHYQIHCISLHHGNTNNYHNYI